MGVMGKRKTNISSLSLVFTCAHHLDDGSVCEANASDGSQFCIDHQPKAAAVPAEAPLAVVGEAMEAVESDLFNANVLDQYAKRGFAALEDEYDNVVAPDGKSTIKLSTLTVEERLMMEKESRDNANAASRIRSRTITNMLDLAKLGLLVGPKGQTPHDVAARKMRELQVDEEVVEAFKRKHAVPSAEEDAAR